ncbi:MAG: hypothetical protein R3185_09125, partial [Candidatus Thermoplasmatota archaeon]|nr:hypothetical protein [Candidatus Thermoplasmatota archaeon]
MQFLARSSLTPDQEQRLRGDPDSRPDSTGRWWAVPDGTEGAKELPVVWLSPDDFHVEAHIPPGRSADFHTLLKDGRWRASDTPDIYRSGIYRLSRSHAPLREAGLPVFWIKQGPKESSVKLRHYQEQAGGDVMVLLEDYDPDEWLAQMLIENAQQAWYQGDQL